MPNVLRQHICKEVMINGVCNAVLNGYIAWLIIKERASLAMWGAEGFAFDLLATAFLLPFIIALIVIPLSRHKVSKGKIPNICWDADSPLHGLLQRLPQGLMLRALEFGLAGLLIVAPLTLLALLFLGATSFTPLQFAIFKGLWAGLLGGLVVAPLIMLGAADRELERHSLESA